MIRIVRRLLTVVLLLVLAGCSPSPRIDPALYSAASERMAWLAAEAHARDVRGFVFRVLDTHSMEPVLRGSDYIVVIKTPWESVEVGRIITYRASWAPDDSPPVVHRLVERDRHGGIAAGDNVRPDIAPNGSNRRSEARHRITSENYVGTVLAIYRSAT